MNKAIKSKKRNNLIRFLPYYKKYVGWVLLDLFCAGITTVCELVLPLIVRHLTDIGINDVGALTIRLIMTVTVSYIALRLIDCAAYYFMSNRGHVTGARLETDMRSDLFKHLQKLSFSYYSDAKIGQIMARMTSDLFDITEFSHHCPEEFFIAGLKIVVSFIILCTMNIPLTIIMFLSIPLIIIVSSFFNLKMKRAFRKQRQSLGEINASTEDTLLGIRVVKSFAREEKEIEKFEKDNATFFNTKKNTYKYMGGFHSLTRAFDGIMYIVVVAFGSYFMMNGKITPADLTAYLLYTSLLIAAIRRLVEFTEQFQRGLTGIDRFFEIIDIEPDIVDGENAVRLERVSGNVTFESVSFRYESDNGFVLNNVNLDIKSGTHVALVGPSGGGKTTLCNLIPRFYDVTSGSIKIDGVDVKDIEIKSLRENIGVVQQDVYLFSGTVFENIAYGKIGATREEVEKAASLAGCDEFISELPNGYDTFVGERGVKLSGGQKQRISIARVFLKNPPILILDEATSALDNESEFIIQKSLERLAVGRTTFTVAHRLSTIRSADLILVLTDDGIVERGTHSELLQLNGLYKKLYDLSQRI